MHSTKAFNPGSARACVCVVKKTKQEQEATRTRRKTANMECDQRPKEVCCKTAENSEQALKMIF